MAVQLGRYSSGVPAFEGDEVEIVAGPNISQAGKLVGYVSGMFIVKCDSGAKARVYPQQLSLVESASPAILNQ